MFVVSSLPLVAGFDRDADPLGRIPARRWSVVVVEEIQEIREGLDFVAITFLVDNFLGLTVIQSVIDFQHDTVLSASDFKFHCHEGYSRDQACQGAMP